MSGFHGTDPSAAVIADLRDAALAADFAITPWLKALLVNPEFYSDEVKRGLVRSPVEFVVTCLHATGRRSTDATPLWLMEGMGQRPLYPPNVSGWKHNGYWVNASAMAKRTDTARTFAWRSMTGYWNGDGLIHLGGGTISRTDIETYYLDRHVELLDEFLDLMSVGLTPASHAALAAHSTESARWERSDLLSLILMSPDLHVA